MKSFLPNCDAGNSTFFCYIANLWTQTQVIVFNKFKTVVLVTPQKRNYGLLQKIIDKNEWLLQQKKSWFRCFRVNLNSVKENVKAKNCFYYCCEVHFQFSKNPSKSNPAQSNCSSMGQFTPSESQSESEERSNTNKKWSQNKRLSIKENFLFRSVWMDLKVHPHQQTRKQTRNFDGCRYSLLTANCSSLEAVWKWHRSRVRFSLSVNGS